MENLIHVRLKGLFIFLDTPYGLVVSRYRKWGHPQEKAVGRRGPTQQVWTKEGPLAREVLLIHHPRVSGC